jgi:hypothetical protein
MSERCKAGNHRAFTYLREPLNPDGLMVQCVDCGYQVDATLVPSWKIRLYQPNGDYQQRNREPV